MINRHNLDIHRFCNKEESRYALQSMMVTPKWTLSTDGKRMVLVTTPEGAVKDFPHMDSAKLIDDHKPFLLPAEQAVAIQKKIPKPNTIPILANAAVAEPEQESGDVHVFTTDLENVGDFKIRKMGGSFPDPQNVWKLADKAILEVTIDARYLLDMAQAIVRFMDDRRKNNPDEHFPVTLRFYRKPEDPIRFDAHNNDTGQHWTALLMPLDKSAVEGIEPDFALPKKPVEASQPTPTSTAGQNHVKEEHRETSQ